MDKRLQVVETALSCYGMKEIPGPKHNSIILDWFARCGHSWVKDDETPYCAAAVGAWLDINEIPGTGKLNALSYLEFGAPVELDCALVGDVVVVDRLKKNDAFAHVGLFIAAREQYIYILGANQSNAVNIQSFDLDDLLGVRSYE